MATGLGEASSVDFYEKERGKNVQKQTGAEVGEVKPVAKEKRESGASLTLSLSSLGCPSDLHFFFSQSQSLSALATGERQPSCTRWPSQWG